jgi:pilus assembly protein CpaF
MSLLDRVQRKAEAADSAAAPAETAAPAEPAHEAPPKAAAVTPKAPKTPPPPAEESEDEPVAGNGWAARATTGIRATPPPPVTSQALVPVAPKHAATTPRAETAPAQSSLLTRTGLNRPGVGKAGGNAALYSSLRAKVHQRLIEDLAGNTDTTPADVVRERIAEIFNEIVSEQSLTLTRQDKQRIIETVIHDVLGLGPLEALLADDDVTEIMINGPKQIYIERAGKLTLSPVTFESNEQLMQVIDRIVSSIGRRVDESSPMVDARLKDGSRVNVIIPPLALRGATVTIRKFAKDALQVDDLVANNSVTDEMIMFLRACVRSRLNVVVSGGTGSGKTTTLNILSGFIPEDERIVTIEDAAELQLRQEHVVTLETRPPNVEGRGRVSIRELVINSLRMRPDRIVIGECRGGEALDMLQAMNTGHDGSLTTLHANNARECISRLETLVLMAGADLPSRAIREQIGSAINIVVQQSRMRDGTRKIVSISEVLGTTGDQVNTQEIFSFRQTGVDEDGNVEGYFTATGVIPHFLEYMSQSGEGVPEDIFKPAPQAELEVVPGADSDAETQAAV